ncbi:MAG: hypothetical protein R3B09_06980 [Nannocystaceae bacterium]
MTRPRLDLLPRASLTLALGSALAVAPLAVAEASAAPSLGMRLRTVMTLLPDEPAGEGEAAEAEADVPEDAPVEEVNEPEVAAPIEGPPPPPADPEPSKGLGLLIPGAVITGVVGVPSTILGTAIVISAHSANDGSLEGGLADVFGTLVGGVFIFFGIVGLGVGVPLLGVGAYKHSRWRDWRDRQRVSLAPSVGRSAYGTFTSGLVLRF